MKTAANWQPFFLFRCALRRLRTSRRTSKNRGLCKILIFLDGNLEIGYELP